ncbi:hypothetical protein TNCV_2243791 [Trichonephila clavipes]|nr:hypothetical protein TNCV_2243791 [Trichonephila clavipes]
MNFVGLNLTMSDRWHEQQQQQITSWTARDFPERIFFLSPPSIGFLKGQWSFGSCLTPSDRLRFSHNNYRSYEGCRRNSRKPRVPQLWTRPSLGINLSHLCTKIK